MLFIRYSNVDLLRSRFTDLNCDKKGTKFGDKNGDKKYCDKIKDSILKVIEQWINLHPEDWTQIKNKKCRQLIRFVFSKVFRFWLADTSTDSDLSIFEKLIRKTLAFCKEERPFTSSLESLTKENLRMAKDIRRAEKLQETKEMFWLVDNIFSFDQWEMTKLELYKVIGNGTQSTCWRHW